jgi:hypothetical protein
VIFDLVARMVAVIAQQGNLQFIPKACQSRAQPLPGKDELDAGGFGVRIEKVGDHLVIDADDSRGAPNLLETFLEAIVEIGKRIIFTFCPIEDDDAHFLQIFEYSKNLRQLDAISAAGFQFITARWPMQGRQSCPCGRWQRAQLH